MEFVAIDFETANQGRDSACEVSLVPFIEGQPAETFTSYIYQEDFLGINMSIHCIKPGDVANAPEFHEMLENPEGIGG